MTQKHFQRWGGKPVLVQKEGREKKGEGKSNEGTL